MWVTERPPVSFTSLDNIERFTVWVICICHPRLILLFLHWDIADQMRALLDAGAWHSRATIWSLYHAAAISAAEEHAFCISVSFPCLRVLEKRLISTTIWDSGYGSNMQAAQRVYLQGQNSRTQQGSGFGQFAPLFFKEATRMKQWGFHALCWCSLEGWFLKNKQQKQTRNKQTKKQIKDKTGVKTHERVGVMAQDRQWDEIVGLTICVSTNNWVISLLWNSLLSTFCGTRLISARSGALQGCRPGQSSTILH